LAPKLLRAEGRRSMKPPTSGTYARVSAHASSDGSGGSDAGTRALREPGAGALREPPLVLLADDYDDALEMYALYLRRLGLEVIATTEDAEALELARTRQPDAIVIDLSTRGHDGVDLTRELQNAHATWNIPIVVLTRAPFPELRAEARAAGASSVLSKPCLPQALVEEVRRVLRFARRRVPVVTERYHAR
jgi:two-component system cell cycle response regulator DivK